jgi:hypothetical protein
MEEHTITVFDIPLFGECSRGDDDSDGQTMNAAYLANGAEAIKTMNAAELTKAAEAIKQKQIALNQAGKLFIGTDRQAAEAMRKFRSNTLNLTKAAEAINKQIAIKQADSE